MPKAKELIPHGVFLILLILSIVFYQERIAIIDAAYQLWASILQDDLAIQSGRWGSVITKIWPYLLLQLGASLKSLMIAYSMAFVVVPYLFFLGLYYLLKEKQLAWILLWFNLLMVNHTFYWVQSELIQATWLLILSVGVFRTAVLSNALKIPLFTGLSFLTIFCHPLIFIPFLFIFLFFLFDDKKQLKSIPFLAMGSIFIAIVLIKFLLLPASDYDTAATANASNILSNWHNFFEWRSNKRFFRLIRESYYLFTLGLIAVMVYYLRQKKQSRLLKCLLMLGFVVGYSVLVNGTFYSGGTHFHVESFHLILGLFILFPFYFDLFPWMQQHKARLLNYLIPIFLIIRIVHIIGWSGIYTQKINWTKQLLASVTQLEGEKFVLIPEDLPDRDIYVLEWSLPIETLLLSAVADPQALRTVIVKSKEEAEETGLLEKEGLFASPFGPLHQETLPERYFDFQSEKAYQMLDRSQLLYETK